MLMKRYTLFSLCFFYFAGFSQFKNQNHSIYFEENKGQFHNGFYQPNNDVLVCGQSNDQQLLIYNNGYSHQLKNIQNIKDKTCQMSFYRVDINWINSNIQPKVLKEHPKDEFTNYYNIPFKPEGIQQVKHFEDVTLKNIYPQIDIHFYANESNEMEYDYLIAPGGDYQSIQFEISGGKTSINLQNELVINTPLGNIVQSAPKVLQNGQQLISKWKKIDDNRWGFYIENVDKNLPLVIDPVIRSWGTYFGGNSFEYGIGCASAPDGSVFISGGSYSSTNIATTGAYQTTLASAAMDAYYAKFSSNGSLVYATYYGGTDVEFFGTIDLDLNNNIFVSGNTSSTTNIATPGAYFTSFTPGISVDNTDSFLVKFSSNGTRLWGTYFGAAGNDQITQAAVDASGNFYGVGRTNATANTATAGTFQTVYGGSTFDAYIVKFSGTGAKIWGSYFGGSGVDEGYGIAVNNNQEVYITGHSTSAGLATSGAHQSSNAGGYDGFIAKFGLNGNRIWSTYVGGASNDFVSSVSIDNLANCVVAGSSSSSSGISTSGANQVALAGATDGILMKFNANGTRLWGTYVGGTANDQIRSVGIAPDNSIFVGGGTVSLNGIANTGAFQTTYGGGTWDGYLAHFTTNGALDWGTYYGGSLYEEIFNVSVINNSEVYLVGQGSSTNGLSSPNAHQVTYGGGSYDAFLAKFGNCQPVQTSQSEITCNNYTWSANGQTYTQSGSYSVVLTNTSGCDSTVTLNLTINPSSMGDESISSCDSFLWNANGSTYTISGTYYAILSNTYGCDSLATLNLTIQNSSDTTLFISAIDSYTFYNQTYTQNGIYTQVLTNSNGCDSTITIDLSLAFTGGIENSKTIFQLFPNPTSSGINIYTNFPDETDYEISDETGRIILQGKISDTKAFINTQALSPGSYFIRFHKHAVVVRFIQK